MSTQGPPRDDGLDGKVAMITGGASGIGRALAVAYARAGANTVIGRFPGDPHDPQHTVDEVLAAGGRCEVVDVDVRRLEDVEAMAKHAVATFGQLDMAIAGAGILRRNALADMTDQSWNDMLEVDLTGVMRTFRVAAAAMRGGALVAISSIAGGFYGWQEHAHYAAAKSGVLGLCRSLAVELAPRGIRVNAVIPGLIRSPQSLDEVNSLGEAGLAAAGRLIPLGRVGTADEAARMIRFLTSDDSAYVTGQEFLVDGGLTVQWPT